MDEYSGVTSRYDPSGFGRRGSQADTTIMWNMARKYSSWPAHCLERQVGHSTIIAHSMIEVGGSGTLASSSGKRLYAPERSAAHIAYNVPRALTHSCGARNIGKINVIATSFIRNQTYNIITYDRAITTKSIRSLQIAHTKQDGYLMPNPPTSQRYRLETNFVWEHPLHFLPATPRLGYLQLANIFAEDRLGALLL